MVRPQVEEHKFRAVPLSGHAPVLGLELQGFLLGVLALHRQGVRVEFRRPGGVILAQGVSRPGRRHQDAFKMWMAGKADAEHVPHLTLVPVGRREDTGSGREAQVFFRQTDFEHDVPIAVDGHELIKTVKSESGRPVRLPRSRSSIADRSYSRS